MYVDLTPTFVRLFLIDPRFKRKENEACSHEKYDSTQARYKATTMRNQDRLEREKITATKCQDGQPKKVTCNNGHSRRYYASTKQKYY